MKQKKAYIKGYTLIEVVLTMGLMLIVVAASMNVLMGSVNGANKATSMAQAKVVGDGVFEWYKNQLTYATEIDIDPSTTEPLSDQTFLSIKDGQLFARDNSSTTAWNVFGEAFYAGMSVQTKISVKSKTQLWLAVEVKNSKGVVIYNTDSSIKSINIELALDKNPSHMGITRGGGSIANYNGDGPTNSSVILYKRAN